MNHTIDVLSAENLPETGSVPAAFILCLIPAAVIFFSRRFRGSTFLRRAAAVLCSVPALFLCAGYLPAAQAQDTCTTWNDVSSWSELVTAMKSDGCIRLTVPDARWIYYNAAPGTEVTIRKGSKDDEETKAIREQLTLAKMPSSRPTLKAGEIPWTDNWSIEDVPQDFPYVYVPQ